MKFVFVLAVLWGPQAPDDAAAQLRSRGYRVEVLGEEP